MPSLNPQTFIKDVPDFPKKGILFKDVTPLLADPEAFKITVDRLAAAGQGKNIQKIVAIEARGFIFGAAVARALNVGFIPVRKKGKLPRPTLGATYQLEYGTDVLEMHQDALKPGENVMLVDDVLATGGTAQAVAGLVEKTGAKLAAVVFVIELDFLKGREKLAGRPVTSLIHY